MIENPVVDRVPYLNALRSIKRERFSVFQRRIGSGIDTCPICLVEYLPNDEVAELNCNDRHCFHSKCLESWLKRKLECPLCKRPVTASQSVPVPGARQAQRANVEEVRN